MAPPSTFADHFPIDPHAWNFEAHGKIDAELRNCDAFWPNATMGALFPRCSAAPAGERGHALLPAAMEHVEWHFTAPQPDSEKWLLYLTCMLRMLSHGSAALDEATLLRLAKFGSRLHSHKGGAAHFDDLAPMVARALAARKDPITPDLARALESMLDDLTRSWRGPNASCLEIAFRLFRSGLLPIPWIRIGDFDSPQWSGLLDLANHYWQSPGVDPKQVPRLKAAIQKVGEANVAALFGRAVEGMEACQPLPPSAAGTTLLRQMLLWIQASPELAVDEPLARLCSIRWEPIEVRAGPASMQREGAQQWLSTLLQTLAKRDPDRAFPYVERLANNESTKNFQEVVGLYEQLMHQMLRDIPIGRTKGVDGFPLSSELHRILDSLERASMPRPYTPGETAVHLILGLPSQHVHLALRQAESDYPGMLRAMNERVRWLVQQQPPDDPHNGRPMPWLAWCCAFGQLYGLILDQKPELEAADLAALCRVDALGWLGVSPAGSIFNSCAAWISKNGFDPELTAAMQEWQKSVHGSISAMALRKQIDQLLWFDTAAPVNEKACWSAMIRKDLRSMKAAERPAWIALLRNVSFTTADKPTKKWMKPAEKLLKQVGAEAFRSRMRSWFAPFQAGTGLKITVAGRDILGSLLWYSQLARDTQVDEAVRWFATAKWKTKADRDRTARLLPIWIRTLTERCPEMALDAIHAYKATGQLALMGSSIKMYEELCQRFDRKPEIAVPPPPPPIDRDALKAKSMQKAMNSVMGGVAQITGDTVTVSNKDSGERYEIGLRDGRIVRVSDGKIVRLEIDWSRPPFGPFKNMMDAGDVQNPLGRNYMRAMLCARVLSGQMHSKVSIVVDES